MERDWFDDYLDALEDPGQKMYFPPDPPSNHKGAKQRLIFDAAASYDVEMRTRVQTARYELEHHSGDSAYEITAKANYLVYSPSTQTILYTTAGGFGGTSSTVTLAAFQALPVSTPASIALSGTPVITTITGLNYYTNLVSLNIANQGKPAVASLSANTFPSTLVDLNLSNNALTSPDVNDGTAFRTKLAQIKYLDLSQNNFSSTFTFGSNTNLVTLNLSGNKVIPSSAVITGNTNLRSINLDSCSHGAVGIFISSNPVLSSISLNNTTTTGGTFTCSNCNLSSINVSSLVNISNLQCYNNSINTLNCSANVSLNTLYCYSNKLTALVLPNSNMFNLLFGGNNLSAVDLNKSNFGSMQTLAGGFNSLTGVDLTVIGNSTGLFSIYLQNNRFTAASQDNMVAQLYTPFISNGTTGVTIDFSGTGNAKISNSTTLNYITNIINNGNTFIYNS